jgi:hypothetical protein
MTFADELRYYLSRDMCLQHVRLSYTRNSGKELESPVYYKRTHGSRSDHQQSLWSGRDYYLRIGS